MHLNRREFITALSAFCLLPQLTACQKSPCPLTVALHPWIGFETLRMAREFNWLPSFIHLQTTKDVAYSIANLTDDLADVACISLHSALRTHANGIPLTVALVFDVSTGAHALLARPSIRTTADLRGKRIGTSNCGVGQLAVANLLKTAGVPLSSVTFIRASAAQHLDIWRNNKVDAVFTCEPSRSLLLREGAHQLADSSSVPDLIMNILAVRQDRAISCTESIKTLIASHFRGLSHLQTNRQDAIYRIANLHGITPNEVRTALEGVMMPNLVANRDYLAPGGRLHKAAERLQQSMHEQALLDGISPLDGFISPDWLP